MQRNRYFSSTQELGTYFKQDPSPTPQKSSEHKRVTSDRTTPYSIRKSTNDIKKIAGSSSAVFQSRKITESLYSSYNQTSSNRSSHMSNHSDISQQLAKENKKIFLKKSPSLQIESLFEPADLAKSLGVHIVPNYFKPQAMRTEPDYDYSSEISIPLNYVTEPIDCSEENFRLPHKSQLKKRNSSYESLPQNRLTHPNKIERSNSFSKSTFKLWASEQTEQTEQGKGHQPIIMKRGGPTKSINYSPSFFTERVTIKPPKMSFDDNQIASVGDESVRGDEEDSSIYDNYPMKAIYANESTTHTKKLVDQKHSKENVMKKVGMGKENSASASKIQPHKLNSAAKPPLYQKQSNKNSMVGFQSVDGKDSRMNVNENKQPLRSKKIFDFDNK